MNRVEIIAEAGVNHNGSLKIAKSLIDIAKDCGADYVKFQSFKTEKIISKKAPKADYQVKNTNNNGSQYDMIKSLELSEEEHKCLYDYCELKGIKFISTPFDIDSLYMLIQLGVDIFKIPSGEITNLPLIREIAKQNKRVILSTGMSNLSDIELALSNLTEYGTNRNNITILHCNTEYPTPMIDVNLNAMKTMEDTFKVKVGYSDHTLGIEVPIAAVALGASIIEKHFTLDKSLSGPDHLSSLDPTELKQMITSIRNIELSLGDGIKKISNSEYKNINIARKSICLSSDLDKGTILKLEHFDFKRPANGLSPIYIDSVVGKKTRYNLKKEHFISFIDIE